MRVRATAPGKLVVLGEYAVLTGAPALGLAVDRQCQVAEDVAIKATGPLEFWNPVSVDSEIDDPVGALAVPINGIGQLLFIPESRCEYFSI